jgi:hypothetical protein
MTTDDTLNGDELVDLYITNQELFAATSSGSTGFDKIVNSPATPNTRAVILNHMGVSFSDLSNPFL